MPGAEAAAAGRGTIDDQFRMAGEPEPQAEPEFPGTLGRSTRRPRVGRAEKELTNLLRWACYDGFVPVRDMHLSHRRLARFTLADLEDAVERNRVYRGAPRFRFRREAGTLWVALSPHLRENRYGQGPDSASGPVPGPDHSGAASTSPGLSESRAVGTPVPATQLYDGGGNIAPWSLAEPGGVDRTAAVVGSGPGQVARGQDFAVDPETGEPLGAAWRPEPPVHTPSLPATDAQEGARLRGPAAPFHDVAAPSGAARNAGAQADGNVYEAVLLQSAVLDDGDTAPPDEEARRRHPEAGAALVIPSSARCAAGSDWIGPEETRLVCRRHGAWRCGICPPTERHPRVADPAAYLVGGAAGSWAGEELTRRTWRRTAIPAGMEAGFLGRARRGSRSRGPARGAAIAVSDCQQLHSSRRLCEPGPFWPLPGSLFHGR